MQSQGRSARRRQALWTGYSTTWVMKRVNPAPGLSPQSNTLCSICPVPHAYPQSTEPLDTPYLGTPSREASPMALWLCSRGSHRRAPRPHAPHTAGGVGVAVLQPRAGPPERRQRWRPAASQAAEQRCHRQQAAASVLPAPGRDQP